MILFREMVESEFQPYLDYFIPDYAAEISANYGLSSAAAYKQAQQGMRDSLPDGPATVGQTLLCILDPDLDPQTLIGYLWYCPDKTGQSVFISDFHILPAYQSKGYGKAALSALEDRLHAAGFEQIRLRVAADNDRAQHVYRSTGFRTTGVNMSKLIR